MIDELFMAKVDQTGECWLWTGYTNPSGYGQLRRQGRTSLAHRFAYELLVGPIPEGLELDHLCRVRHCIRPDHLEPVTHQENLLRGDTTCSTIRAQNAAATRCPKGHPYDAANTYRHGGRRHCRACRAEQARRSYARRAAA